MTLFTVLGNVTISKLIQYKSVGDKLNLLYILLGVADKNIKSISDRKLFNLFMLVIRVFYLNGMGGGGVGSAVTRRQVSIWDRHCLAPVNIRSLMFRYTCCISAAETRQTPDYAFKNALITENPHNKKNTTVYIAQVQKWHIVTLYYCQSKFVLLYYFSLLLKSWVVIGYFYIQTDVCPVHMHALLQHTK